MKLFATAATLLVLATLTVVVSQVTNAPSSAFGEALSQLRGAKAMSYTETIAIEGQPRIVSTKSFVAEDGRKRTEHKGGTVTVFDATGHIRISLMNNTKTAIVADPRPSTTLRLDHKPFLRWLEMLRKLGDKPDKELGAKDFDGKPANGYVATLANRTFTLWVDNASGDPVLVEYDSEINGKPAHITMSDFRFGEEFPESFFSFDVPPGFKVYGQPEDGVKIATQGLETVWSHKGFWTSVASACGEPLVHGLAAGQGQVIALDAEGKSVATTPIGGNRDTSLRLANLVADEDVEFLTFQHWGEPSVHAHRADGTLLWSFEEKAAVNDVCAADLDGDGLDEVIISYNGGGGVCVLSIAGELLWKDSELRNVWHVTAGKFTGDGHTQVVTTSSSGKVHVFDAQGKRLQELEPGFYANLVRPWRRTADGKDIILVAGGDKADFALAALSLPGKIDWSVELPARPQHAAASRQRPWLAIALGDGSVRVIDLATAKEIAQVGGHGGNADVAWLDSADSPPLLVVADHKSLVAYSITEPPASSTTNDAPAK
ncbi:MAG: hypothetical protein WD845_17260 [Pirellulales bacterium]